MIMRLSRKTIRIKLARIDPKRRNILRIRLSSKITQHLGFCIAERCAKPMERFYPTRRYSDFLNDNDKSFISVFRTMLIEKAGMKYVSFIAKKRKQ